MMIICGAYAKEYNVKPKRFKANKIDRKNVVKLYKYIATCITSEF